MRHAKTTTMIVALVLAIPAYADDWSTYQHDPAHTGYSAASINAPLLAHVWSTPAGYSSPTIANGFLYATSNSSVTAFNLANGSIAWSTPVAGAEFTSVSGGTLVTTSYSFGQNKSLDVLNTAHGSTGVYRSVRAKYELPGCAGIVYESDSCVDGIGHRCQRFALFDQPGGLIRLYQFQRRRRIYGPTAYACRQYGTCRR